MGARLLCAALHVTWITGWAWAQRKYRTFTPSICLTVHHWVDCRHTRTCRRGMHHFRAPRHIKTPASCCVLAAWGCTGAIGAYCQTGACFRTFARHTTWRSSVTLTKGDRGTHACACVATDEVRLSLWLSHRFASTHVQTVAGMVALACARPHARPVAAHFEPRACIVGLTEQCAP